MGEGRIAVTMVVFGLLVVSTNMAYGKVFPVGNNDGTCDQDACWSAGASDSLKNKTIVPGDVLEFNYSIYFGNVVVVDEEGYNTCNPGRNPIIYGSGHDYLQVPEGPSYYICSLNRLCTKGMKIAIIPKK